MNSKITISAEDVIAIVKHHVINQLSPSSAVVGVGKPGVREDEYGDLVFDGIDFEVSIPVPKN